MKLFLILIFLLINPFMTSAKEIKARFTEKAPAIDGNINSPEWSLADSTSGFIQLDPQKGSAASEKTIVYMLQDNDNLYFAFKCTFKG